jgi:DNA repair ATPase RecN
MIVVDPKVEKIEHRIKELNAIRGEYRAEVDEAEVQLKKRKITKEEFDRIKSKCDEKMGQINDKVKVCHDELHELRAKK